MPKAHCISDYAHTEVHMNVSWQQSKQHQC